MDDSVTNLINSIFFPTIRECEKFCFIVRGIEYQRDAVQKLETLLDQIANIKRSMVHLQDEDSANCCLGLEKVACAIQHQLKFWIAIKEDRIGDAWDELMHAESAADAAIRAHKMFDNMVNYFERLQVIEQLLFPEIIFLSPGYTVLSSRCTICSSDYGSCDHLKGLPYMGEFCSQELIDIRIQEVSIVNKPANRHARVTSMSFDGVMRDLLTWREERGNQDALDSQI